MRLLLVEDDVMIGEMVLHLLRTEHYAVDQSARLGGLRAELRMALATPIAALTLSSSS